MGVFARRVLPVGIVLGALALAAGVWYATLMPFWVLQSGERGPEVFYRQGMGLWLNFTEHVGDPAFDPGNALWVPPQGTAVHTFAMQCTDKLTFCANAVGELHGQYCEVMRVYCGPIVTGLQVVMSLLSGTALLAAVWSVHLTLTLHRTVIDHYLMQLCIANGLSFLVVASAWYFGFFRTVLNTTFYKDQYNRCIDNPRDRTCWHMGPCVYIIVGAAVLYPFHSVLVASYVTHKFRRYQRQLRRLYETTTTVELPPAGMAVKSESVNEADDTARGLDVTTGRKKRTKKSKKSSQDVKPSATRGGDTITSSSRTLAPLQPQGSSSSSIKQINVHELAVQVMSDEDEEEKAQQDAIKYGNREFTVVSPRARSPQGTSLEAEAKSPLISPKDGDSSSGIRKSPRRDKSTEF